MKYYILFTVVLFNYYYLIYGFDLKNKTTNGNDTAAADDDYIYNNEISDKPLSPVIFGNYFYIIYLFY